MLMYRLKDGFMVRKIGEQIMAVPTGKLTSEIHGMIALSDSAEKLWQLLEKGAEIDELAFSLTELYEVEYPAALVDAQKFVDGLKEQGALQ